MTLPIHPDDEASNAPGYAQGYRDGLLTARSALLATRNVETAVRALDALIDHKNQDLWNLLALVQVSNPEAAALRSQLRVPFGAAIDSEGRMLFLRVPNHQPSLQNPSYSLEYDTGVMGLLKRIAELERQLPVTEGK